MAHNIYIQLFVLFLGFSYVLSSSAVPTTRSLKPIKEDPSAQKLVFESSEVAEEMVDFERRMDIERLDYAESSASHQHDPKIPGGRA